MFYLLIRLKTYYKKENAFVSFSRGDHFPLFLLLFLSVFSGFLDIPILLSLAFSTLDIIYHLHTIGDENLAAPSP